MHKDSELNNNSPSAPNRWKNSGNDPDSLSNRNTSFRSRSTYIWLSGVNIVLVVISACWLIGIFKGRPDLSSLISAFIFVIGILVILLFSGISIYSLYLYSQQVKREVEIAAAKEKQIHEQEMLAKHVSVAKEKRPEEEQLKMMAIRKDLLTTWMETQKPSVGQTKTEKQIWEELGTTLEACIKDMFKKKNDTT